MPPATLDFTQPVAVMLIGLLHCIPDSDDPAGLVARLMAATAAGSYLVIARLELAQPGLVQLHRWCPGPDGPVPDHDLANYGAVARKP